MNTGMLGYLVLMMDGCGWMDEKQNIDGHRVVGGSKIGGGVEKRIGGHGRWWDVRRGFAM
jgi:hypothetical protein